MVSGSTAWKIAYTPGRRPVGSEVIRGSSGTRWKTNSLGQSSVPSPQSRAVSNGLYAIRSRIFLAFENVRPPSDERANETPKFLCEEANSKSRQMT